MPMPTPRTSEDHEEFIDRCMGDDVMVEEYDDPAQRRAVCESQWQREKEDVMPTTRARGPVLALPEACVVDAAGRTRCPDRMGNWFSFTNEADDAPVDIRIYDEIVDTFEAEFFGFGVSALGFVEQLADLQGRPLNVHINSPGGLVFGGIAIYNAIRNHDAPVHVFVDGIAASISSLIAMAGDTVTMAPHAMLMIHEAQGMTIGGPGEHAKQLEILEKLSDNIAAVYAERGDKRTNWRAKMADETWLSDQDAVRLGLADDIDTARAAVANTFDLSGFKNAPAALFGRRDGGGAPTKRQVEKALRDAGLPAEKAKAFISVGWNVLDARDAPEDEPADEFMTPEQAIRAAIDAAESRELPPSGTDDAQPNEYADLFARVGETLTLYGAPI